MKNNILYIISLAIFSLNPMVNGLVASSINIEYVISGSLAEEKALFNRAFKEAYKNIPLEVLKIESLETFLEAAFEDEPIDLNNPNKKVFCACAKHEGALVGFITFEEMRDQEVYIRQLAVDSCMQHKGIGKALVACVKEKLPKTQRLILATRKVNLPACNFYRKLGFQECEHVPHDLNSERYIGFEKNI